MTKVKMKKILQIAKWVLIIGGFLLIAAAGILRLSDVDRPGTVNEPEPLPDTITEFSYPAILNECEWYRMSTGLVEFYPLEDQLPKIVDKMTLEKEKWTMMVVRAGTSRNTPWGKPEGSKKYIPLPAWETQEGIHQERQISEFSVRTDCEILEILYGGDKTFSEGEMISVTEPYFIVDGRMPILQEELGGNFLCSWDTPRKYEPLQDGEIYCMIVFRAYLNSGVKNPKDLETVPVGHTTYKLSGPRTQAGYERDEEAWQNNFQWLLQNYDLQKYMTP
jgi:hypothetical protein